ncbi:hypothetical protein L1987_29983 [Smallanthus sonchifolius]|uniref:Uncharacterized protein n=1 Tax=Smallanthus sonchifolius TaxID=185202 RepID=A0ACB9I333_9ASTR|nr:hypothetical protein L1987_29983 [Smallanthus sonchifolius]
MKIKIGAFLYKNSLKHPEIIEKKELYTQTITSRKNTKQRYRYIKMYPKTKTNSKSMKMKRKIEPTNTKVPNQESFQDQDLWVGLDLCLLGVLEALTGFPNKAQQPETFGDGGSIVDSTSTDLYGLGSAFWCSVFSVSSSSFGFTGLSSPDSNLSSHTSPEEPDLLNDISDLANPSMFVMVLCVCEREREGLWAYVRVEYREGVMKLQDCPEC